MTQLDPSAMSARNRLLVMFVLLCSLDIAIVFMAQDRWAIARVLFTIVVMYFVMQGYKWAKWLLISLCSLVVVALITMLALLSSKLAPTLVVGSWLMIGLSIMIPIYMVSSQHLNRYFFYKRQAYSQ